MLRFALNHRVAPQLGLPAFFALARAVGADAVEIRNDIADRPIIDGTSASRIRAWAEEAGVAILTINALQKFDRWDADRAAEATALARYCRDCGAGAVILVPANDGTGLDQADRRRGVLAGLAALRPILEDAGLTGLVEPLGFASCSLRSKAEAAHAITKAGGPFRLTHDTFHHHLAGEAELFPALTGLVHVSGVVDPALATDAMRDAHRVLVDDRDRLGTVDQLRALAAGGYTGYVSFEPFADELRSLADPAAAIAASRSFIESRLLAAAA